MAITRWLHWREPGTVSDWKKMARAAAAHALGTPLLPGATGKSRSTLCWARLLLPWNRCYGHELDGRDGFQQIISRALKRACSRAAKCESRTRPLKMS